MPSECFHYMPWDCCCFFAFWRSLRIWQRVPYFRLILLAIAGVNIAIFVYVILAAKNDAKAFEARPCVLCSHTGIKYDDFIKELEDLSNKGKRLSISENLHYFKFKKGLYLTTIIYRTDNFSKREFDNAKKRILRKATKEFNLSHSNYDKYKIYKTIQLNIICLDSMNSEVNSLLSHNANHNLMRVEAWWMWSWSETRLLSRRFTEIATRQ